MSSTTSPTQNGEDADYRALKNGLRRLLQQPHLIEKLKSQETKANAMKELRLPSESVRADLINLLIEIDDYARQSQGAPVVPSEGGLPDAPQREIGSAKEFFESVFQQLRRAYQISLLMSVTMFLFGTCFLGLAAYQAIYNPQNAATVSIVGGLGIIQIVALFYRNPLADIARSVSNAQQAKISITSYLIGITLIHDSIGTHLPGEQHLKSLLELTDKALGQLQTYAEDHQTAHKRVLVEEHHKD
jgi:hypothetical protein